MGKTIKSGLGSGIGSSPQISISQTSYDNKMEKLLAREEMIKPLIDAGVKFNSKDVIFVTHDKMGRLIWLETGNSNSGLNHIVMKHSDDFLKKHNVKKEQIPSHIKSIVQNGDVEYYRTVRKGNRDGLEILYSKNNQYYLLSGIGTNGFMVSAYPIDKDEANRLKGRYKK